MTAASSQRPPKGLVGDSASSPGGQRPIPHHSSDPNQFVLKLEPPIVSLRPPFRRADHKDELRRLLDVPGDHLRRRAPAARRLLPLRLLQLAVLHLPAAHAARLRPRHRLLRLRHPQDAAGAAGHRRRPALLHPRLKNLLPA